MMPMLNSHILLTACNTDAHRAVELPPTSRLKKLVDYEKISRLIVD
jgi:hypothetical protein